MFKTTVAYTALLSISQAFPTFQQSLFKRDLDLSLSSTSCSSSELSCGSTSDSLSERASNSCCVETEGLILQTQFWDTDVSGSPSDSWTIHGLWPDKCDGSYDSNCGYSDTVSSVSDVLLDAGEDNLVSYMKKYWLNDGGSSQTLWNHEYNKHGTCMSTLGSSCLSSSDSVVNWAKLTVKTFQGLPTYDWLKEAGITPSESKKYSADDISSALKEKFGKEVYIGCKSGALNQVWYFHKVKGSLLNDDLVKIDSVSKSSCSGSVKYLPKSQS